MWNMSLFLRNSIFTRVTLTFIFVLTPLLTVGIIIYSNGVSSIHEDIGTFTQKQNDAYLDNFENDLKRIRTLQYDLFYDDDLQFLSRDEALLQVSPDFYNRDKSILRIRQRLTTIKASSQFIEDVVLLLPGTQLVITPQSNGNFTSEHDILVHNLSHLKAQPLSVWQGKLNLVASYPFISDVNTSPLFIVQIIFSPQGIQKMLQNLYIDDQEGGAEGSFLYSSTLGYIQGSEDDNKTRDTILQSYQHLHNSSFNPIAMNGHKYTVINSSSSEMKLVLFHYIPDEKLLSRTHNYRRWLILFAIISIIIILVFSLSIYRMIHSPLVKLVRAFRNVNEGNLSIQIQHSHMDEFKFIYESFNIMAGNLHQLIEQSFKSKILLQKAELKQLQSQINPHFLYNSFFILQKRIKYGEHESALLFAEKLGIFFQFITRNSNEEAPLAKEVEHAQIYADIQGSRFARRVQIMFESLPKEWEKILVPRMIIQPIIENAFEHSLEKLEEDGKMQVWYEEHEFERLICMQNNGHPVPATALIQLRERLETEDDQLELTGMVNIHKRLILKYGNLSGLRLDHASEGGLLVTIVLPKKEEHDVI